MGENKELKVKSFRIDEETAEKFKEVANEIGGNQQETLAKLIEAYEFQKGKAILTERKADIEKFEKYVSCLTTMYMSSLEDNQNITETVQIQFEALLKSKDEVIKYLQGQLKAAKELKEEATKKAKSLTDENARLNTHIDSLEQEYASKMDDMQSMLSDKDELNKALTNSYDSLKAQVESMREDCSKTVEYKKELENLQKKHNKLTIDFNVSQADLNNLKEKHEQTIKDMENHEKEAIERVREQFKTELDKAIMEKEHQRELKELQQENWANMQKFLADLSKQPRDNNSNNNNKNNPKVTDTEQTTEQ